MKIIETYNASWCAAVGYETLGGLQQEEPPADGVNKPLPAAAALPNGFPASQLSIPTQSLQNQ
jgi:hypothetical protein